MAEPKVYNTSPTFIPNNINEISIDFIINYCTAKGKADIAWLKALAAAKVAPDKNGRERRISFIEIRKEFVKKYFPSIAPAAKEKKPTMYERIAAL